MSKIDDFSFRGMPRDVRNFKDAVTYLLNYGKVAFPVLSAAPTYNTGEGELAVVRTGTDHRLYVRSQSSWQLVKGTSAINIQTFTATGTWTKPDNSTRVHVTLWAGGASGGRGSGTTRGGGGGGGGYMEAWFAASTLGATESVTIGAGGVAGTGDAQNGTAGGNSVFGPMTAYGGGGGGGAGGGTNVG